MHVLVTGFEPFEGVPSNPTQRILAELPARLGGIFVVTAVLPVDTRAVRPVLVELWRRAPSAILHLGVASKAQRIRLEERAENRLAFRVADNAGRSVRDEPIEPGGPEHVPARLPLDAIATRWAQAGVDFERSTSAGTFLCNQVMYASLRGQAAPSGFVHVPPDEALAEELGHACPLPLPEQTRAVQLAVEATIETLQRNAARS